MYEPFRLLQKVVHVVNPANRKTCVALLRNHLAKPSSSNAHFRTLTGKKEDEKFQQIVHVKFELEKLINPIVVMDFLIDKVKTGEAVCKIL